MPHVTTASSNQKHGVAAKLNDGCLFMPVSCALPHLVLNKRVRSGCCWLICNSCCAGTYEQGSHVLQFGSLGIDVEPVGDYQGDAGTGMPSCVIQSMVGIVDGPPRCGRLPGQGRHTSVSCCGRKTSNKCLLALGHRIQQQSHMQLSATFEGVAAIFARPQRLLQQ